MHRKRLATLLLLAASATSAPATAHTSAVGEFVCPIDGEEFSQSVTASGTSFGRMLDLKPYGPIAAPWALPVCPTTGFVMYRMKFSAEEIAKLKPYVDSHEYWAMRRTEATYYLAAKLQGVLGEADETIAATLLQATWQAEGRDQYERYAREALMIHRRLLEAAPREDQKRITYELVSGELERRLGMFEQAHQRFERLKPLEAFGTGVFPNIVELQLKLVSAKDTNSHRVPRKSPQAVRSAER